MKKILSILSVGAILCTASCKKDFNSLQTDPNRAKSAPASLILNGVLSDIYDAPFSPTQRWNQFYACNYAYYGDQQYTWTGVSYNNYSVLKNLLKMEEESIKTTPAPNAYTSLSKFFKAYLFYKLTLQTGDVPLTEALKGIENFTPKYNSQKDVFKQILVWLEDANTDMASIITKTKATNIKYDLSNDFYYGNDLEKWRKAVNSFKIRVLIQLSKQEADADLNIKQKFTETFTNPSKYPVFAGISDNMEYVHNAQYNKYPTNPESFGFDAARYNMTSTFLNTLVGLNDPRTFYVAEPAAALVAGGAAPNSFAAFAGAGSGEDLATMSANAGLGKYSFINRKRYYSTFTAQNTIQIGYAEMCFNIAEAMNRGWITGTTEEWYKKGIQATIGFYGIVNGSNNVYFQKAGGGVSDYNTYSINYDWATYYAQSTVEYAGNNAVGLNQIITQKYLAFYQNSGWEAYYNWRRTGIPSFHTGPGTGNSNRIALRFQYPTSEKSINVSNVNSAIQTQFAGQDDINAKMWIVK